ncbi:MAG: hypothetical protein M3Y57_00120 [Acidobacteriota bacterium]|nr:hypothetical protein [Acidobacteriota bacterium]
MPGWLFVGRDIERAFVENFITPVKRERWLELLRTEKGRRKLRASLADFTEFDPATVVPLPPKQQHASSIFQVLTGLGAPTTCYLISENSEWDATERNLQSALQQVVGYGFGTIITCKPGALAYFEGEGPGHRFILRKSL